MKKIKILIKGYARKEKNLELASSTTTLIQENNLNIIVDPGMNRKLLLKSLEKENLSPKDINYVILTHTHLDHCLLTGIFENAIIFDNLNTYTFDGKIGEHEGKVPGTEIKIIRTPGHDQFHCSVLINDEEFGKVVIASDVFWWSDDEKQKTDRESLMNHKDLYMKNKEELMNSREKILEIADYIIPGHGEMFKVEK